MKEYFIYDDKVYESKEAVDEAIIEKIGHNYNNIDVIPTGEFELEAQSIITVTVDEATDLTPEKPTYTAVEPTTTTNRIKEKENYEK